MEGGRGGPRRRACHPWGAQSRPNSKWLVSLKLRRRDNERHGRDLPAVGSPSIADYCSDGSGRILVAPFGDSDFDDALFQWEVLPNPAGRWNEPRVLMYMDDFELAALLRAAAGLAGLTWILDEEVIDEENPGAVFDNPTCGQ